MKIFLPMIAIVALSACGGGASEQNTTADTNVLAADEGTGAPVGTGNDMAMTPEAGAPGTVTVTVSGVTPNGGPVLVALQDSASFAQAAGTYSARVDPTSATVTATISGVTAGRYAAAAVQDTDGDGTLTLGEQGPSEPFGFSGTAQTTGAPTFEPAAFEVADTGGTASVTLRPR